MGGWVGGLAGSPPAGSHQSWAWAGPCLREGPWHGCSAHSGQNDSSTRHMLGAGWALPPSLTPPPRPSPRCGLLHLPLPTVDLPRRPHAGERVWHERRGPNCSCPLPPTCVHTLVGCGAGQREGVTCSLAKGPMWRRRLWETCPTTKDRCRTSTVSWVTVIGQ